MADLKSSLNKFNQQQVKLQQSMVGINRSAPGAKKKSSKPGAAAPPQPAAPAAAAAPPMPQPQSIASLTFQNDKEKLQAINQVRRSPTMAQVKRVIDILLETRRALLPDEINNLCFVDVNNNREVFETLKNNVKVTFDGQRFSYKAKHDIKNKTELLVFLRKNTEGMALSEIKDAYPAVVSDVQELKAAGDVRGMCNSDSQEEILYADDPRAKIKVDDEIVKLCRSIEVPADFVLVERELLKFGMKPMTNSAERRDRMSVPISVQEKQKQKKKKMSKRTKYTNIHLPDLFNNLPSDM